MIGLILDHILQSTLFVAVAGLLTFFFKSNSASVRYGIWLSASLKFLFPLVLLTAAGRAISQALSSPPPTPLLIQTLGGAAQPFSHAVSFTLPTSPTSAPWDWGPILAVIWFFGFATVCTIWARQWLKLREIVQSAVPSKISAPLPVLSSPSQLEPGLVGVWSPVLLLPTGIADHLSPNEMEAIVAHEVCHLRRRDNFTAALHMAVEATFWFYPLVWWLETRLIAERERACDEGVVASGRDPQIYAESIIKVCKYYVLSPLPCVAGISGADLKRRMEMIIESRFAVRLNAAKKLLLAGCAAVVIAAPISVGLFTMLPILAQTAATAPSPKPEAALRQQIEGWQKHQPAVEAMSPNLAKATMSTRVHFQQEFDAWGVLKSVTFKGVDYHRAYVYSVEFASARRTCVIELTQDSKVSMLRYENPITRSNLSGPEPGTEAALRRFIDGLHKGQPVYDLLDPAFAVVARSHGDLTNLVKDFQPWGALKSLTFQKVAFEGLDQFEAVYEHGRSIWLVGPLADGMIYNFSVYREVPKTPEGMLLEVRSVPSAIVLAWVHSRIGNHPNRQNE